MDRIHLLYANDFKNGTILTFAYHSSTLPVANTHIFDTHTHALLFASGPAALMALTGETRAPIYRITLLLLVPDAQKKRGSLKMALFKCDTFFLLPLWLFPAQKM